MLKVIGNNHLVPILFEKNEPLYVDRIRTAQIV